MRFGRSPQTSAYVVALVIALAICLLTAARVTNAVPVASAAPAPMVLTYSTTLGGTTFALPLSGGSVTVDWGDGTTNAVLTHTYATGGVYTISISGTATHFGNAGYLGGSGVTAVTSFGDLGLTDLSGAFAGATHLTSVPAVLPSGVTNTSHMFAGASMFNQPIGGWNTASVTNMAGMFAGATVFNQPIGGWNTASVTNMAGMFDATGAFNQPIGGWNTASVTNMSQMFEATGAFNQPIGTWNTAAVTGMSYMFQGATAFNQPIGTWNTARVTNMSHMFQGVWGRPPSSGGRWTIMSDFNRPIGAWNTAQVTDMSYMFEGAVRFNQPIGSWKTARVSSMQGMFEYASAFNQPIGTVEYRSGQPHECPVLRRGPVQPADRDLEHHPRHRHDKHVRARVWAVDLQLQPIVDRLGGKAPNPSPCTSTPGIPPTTAQRKRPTTPSASRMRGRSLMAAGRLTRPRHRSLGPRASLRPPTAEHSRTQNSSPARPIPEAGST